MNNSQKVVVLTELIEQMLNCGSWCGETHIQKETYFLQTLTDVPLEFKFALYKHGPYSFELRDKLTELRADEFLELVRRPRPYGPSYETTEHSNRLRMRFKKTMAKYRGPIEFVAKHLGNKGVVELEQLSTALLVREQLGRYSAANKRA